LCQPHKTGHENRWNAKEEQRLKEFETFTISHGFSITESNPLHYSIGIDAEKPGRMDGEGFPEKLQPFQDLLRQIPVSARIITSQCGKRHYLALEAMRFVPEFEAFLEQEFD